MKSRCPNQVTEQIPIGYVHLEMEVTILKEVKCYQILICLMNMMCYLFSSQTASNLYYQVKTIKPNDQKGLHYYISLNQIVKVYG